MQCHTYNMVMVIMVLKSSRVFKSPARDEKSISIKQMQRKLRRGEWREERGAGLSWIHSSEPIKKKKKEKKTWIEIKPKPKPNRKSHKAKGDGMGNSDSKLKLRLSNEKWKCKWKMENKNEIENENKNACYVIIENNQI